METLVLGTLTTLVILVVSLIVAVLYTRGDGGTTTAVATQMNDINMRLQKIIHQQEEVRHLGQRLTDTLQRPKIRGIWGENILEEMLNNILPKGFWERQYAIDGNTRVDCIIKFQDVIIPIDSKFPRDDYMRYQNAEVQEEKERYWKEFEGAVKRQIKDIKDKYIRPEKGTSETALMFIPSEPIFYATVQDINDLGQSSTIQKHAQDCNVMLVSPNSFYAYLQILILGIRNVEVIRSAKEIQKGLSALQASFKHFYKKYEDIGKNIDGIADTYRIGNDHVRRYKRQVDTTLELEGFTERGMVSSPEKTEASNGPV